jgi:hypothetical protein
MSDNLNALQEALAQARANAGAIVPSQPTTQAANPGRAVTMREMLTQQTSMSVKSYLKVDRVAFLLGKDDTNTLFSEFDVEFRFSQAKPFFGLRYGSSPAKYDRSYDRQVNAKTGRSWADCIAQAQQIDSRCRGDYLSVDIPFTLTAPAKDKKGKVLVEVGEAIGWTASITNYKDFAEFAKPFYALMDQGVLSEDALVRGKIVHEVRKGNETYGGLTFVDFELVDNGLGEGSARQ